MLEDNALPASPFPRRGAESSRTRDPLGQLYFTVSFFPCVEMDRILDPPAPCSLPRAQQNGAPQRVLLPSPHPAPVAPGSRSSQSVHHSLRRAMWRTQGHITSCVASTHPYTRRTSLHLTMLHTPAAPPSFSACPALMTYATTHAGLCGAHMPKGPLRHPLSCRSNCASASIFVNGRGRSLCHARACVSTLTPPVPSQVCSVLHRSIDSS